MVPMVSFTGRLHHTWHLMLKARVLSTLLQAAKAQPSVCTPEDMHQRRAAPVTHEAGMQCMEVHARLH